MDIFSDEAFRTTVLSAIGTIAVAIVAAISWITKRLVAVLDSVGKKHIEFVATMEQEYPRMSGSLGSMNSSMQKLVELTTETNDRLEKMGSDPFKQSLQDLKAELIKEIRTVFAYDEKRAEMIVDEVLKKRNKQGH